MKRVLLILAYPFILIYSVFSLPFKIAYIIIKDTSQRRRQSVTNKNPDNIDFFDIGDLLYTDYKDEFKSYYDLYRSDIKQFNKAYRVMLENRYDKNLKPIEVLHLFGDFKQMLCLIDWKGEENEYEIEEFISTQVDQKIGWTNASLIRTSKVGKSQRDGKFIIELFKAIDKDLEFVGRKLLFFDMGWDAYVFMAVKRKQYAKISGKAPNNFQGVDDL